MAEEQTIKAKANKKMGLIGCGLLIAVVIFLAVVISTCVGGGNSTVTPKYTATPELQQQRYDLMNKMIAEGIFYKVEKPGTYAHVFVTPYFKSLNIDDKNTFINVVWAYYICGDPGADIVVIYDSQTGKELGTYSEVQGGLKLK